MWKGKKKLFRVQYTNKQKLFEKTNFTRYKSFLKKLYSCGIGNNTKSSVKAFFKRRYFPMKIVTNFVWTGRVSIKYTCADIRNYLEGNLEKSI